MVPGKSLIYKCNPKTQAMFTQRLCFFSALTLLCMSAKAQFPNPADFNTATNATNTGTLSVGSNDLHWIVAMSNSVRPYVPAKSCGSVYTGWVASPYANANWISYPRNCTPGDWAELLQNAKVRN
jgi:hypothetical protein